MDDVISRQEVIDTLDKHLRTTDVPVSYPGIISALTEWLNEVPSAQQDSKETSPTHKALDTISRKAAIRWVKTECNPYGKPTLDFESGKKVIEHLKQMPSAQPEKRTEERTETHGVCLDTISRNAAIDALTRKMVSIPTAGEKDLMGDVNRIRTEDISAIRRLPSAQPEHTSNNDCNGCKFVGCYDTDFPCANCIRKNKDYYAPERRTDEHDDIFE